MSHISPNHLLTEKFFTDTVPTFFAENDPTNIEAAYLEFVGRVEEVAGHQGEYASRVAWEAVPWIASQLDPSAKLSEQRYLREIAEEAGHSLFYIGDFPPKETAVVTSTGVGTLIVVDDRGHLKSGINTYNPQVPAIYGAPDPYVLVNLGNARVGEVLAQQGADWGEGYKALTNFLRKIGKIGIKELPHVGMATAHEISYGSVAKGTDRVAMAYASASHYTFTAGSISNMMRYEELQTLRRKDIAAGLVNNEKDWLAGRLDSLIASVANALYLGKEPSNVFPDLNRPDYVNVDNN